MDDTEWALEALRAASIAAENTRPEVTEEYLALIREVEALPENAPASDKTAHLGRLVTRGPRNVIGPLPRRE
ncbi:MAG: hypothetical protein ACRD1V_14630 [Vicinamibacterales bacterium]